ncbi:MAG TPA: T9SS type A sorting domain-containing protein, partial [Saprospiraceae bacterium]|nr:T9SS type A sorting domain-containing protein [Saprospiraceae bacterium]
YEFVVSDVAHPDCFDSVNPGIIDCGVATENILPDEYFAVFNNGTLPGILAKKNLSISLFNANGKSMVSDLNLIQDAYYEFKTIPDGFYILTVKYGQQTWPVKLIRTGF